MRWPVVLAASAAVHAAAIAAWPTHRDLFPPPPPPPPPSVELGAPAPAPVAIELVHLPDPANLAARLPVPPPPDLEPAIPQHDLRGRVGPQHDLRDRVGERGVTTAVDRGVRGDGRDEHGVGGDGRDRAGAERGRGAGMLGMRRAGEAGPGFGVNVAGETIARIVEQGPGADPRSGRLEANRDGTYTGRDLVFDAHVDADGHVSDIRDKPNVWVKVAIPRPGEAKRALGDHLEAWSDDPYGTSGSAGSDTLTASRQNRKDPNDKGDGRVYTILRGGFDATDALMRWAGQDPYDARKKAFLDETFDERVEIGERHRAREYARSDRTVAAHLEKVWARDDLDLAAKKAAIFELWDDCAEPGDGVEPALAEAGERARRAVLRFAAVRLPAGSGDAYSADELARLNARRKSRASFSPYE